ncbi:MAG: hypothetical protein KQ78_01798 [Candidatus Izimaplasma bacterium HR2]|nr:MAG: hypothetical protein KQ78_01798 [Candidatus Izimaplasma bacterium HR2]
MTNWEPIYGYNDLYMISKDGQFKKGNEVLETFLREDDKEYIILISKTGEKCIYLVSTLLKKYFPEDKEK